MTRWGLFLETALATRGARGVNAFGPRVRGAERAHALSSNAQKQATRTRLGSDSEATWKGLYQSSEVSDLEAAQKQLARAQAAVHRGTAIQKRVIHHPQVAQINNR